MPWRTLYHASTPERASDITVEVQEPRVGI